MRYLLIDFGASYIKNIVFDSDKDEYTNPFIVESPFITNNIIEKNKILSVLQDIISKYQNIDRIITCSIMGGYYKDNLYYCWKEPQVEKNYCLISGLFSNTTNFHIHTHHKENTLCKTYEDKLKILGYINNIPIYSSLADTLCVAESLQIDENDVIINMGTGSQVIYKNTKHSYIPSGRAFLVFQELFSSLGLNMFDLLKQVTIQDVINSTLSIDLNVFKQSHKYKSGGHIAEINESNFNINNLLGSILKEFVNQYRIYLTGNNNIILTGGIPKKLPILKPLFEIYYPNIIIIHDENNIENTHRGMVSYIKKYL